MSGGMEDTHVEIPRETLKRTGRLDLVDLRDVIEQAELTTDMVNRPKHYRLVVNGHRVDAMDIIRAVLGEDGWKAYCKGNMLKYLLRDKWDADEDVAKSGRYADMYKGDI